MTEKYIMRENSIPDGMLHDQDLYEISLKDGILILSFNIFLSKEEYGDSDFAKKYFEYRKCHIRCKIENEEYCEVYLKSSLNKKFKGIIQYLSLADFVDIANKEITKRTEKGFHPWEYLYTYVSPNIRSLAIELHIWLKYKRVVYTNCILVLNTNEIEFIWE